MVDTGVDSGRFHLLYFPSASLMFVGRVAFPPKCKKGTSPARGQVQTPASRCAQAANAQQQPVPNSAVLQARSVCTESLELSTRHLHEEMERSEGVVDPGVDDNRGKHFKGL